MKKFVAVCKFIAGSSILALLLYISFFKVSTVLHNSGISLTNEVQRFLRESDFWVLLVSGIMVCSFVYILIMAMRNASYGDDDTTGFAYCYGHRQEGEAYYERGTLTFADKQLIFEPYNKSSHSFAVPYDRLVKSKVDCENKKVPFYFMLLSRFHVRTSLSLAELYRISIKYIDPAGRERILDIGLPHFTHMMATVRKKLYS